MIYASSQKTSTGYCPVLRRSGPGNPVVHKFDYQCRNRDETTHKNIGASNLANLVMRAVVDPDLVRDIAYGPIPPAVAELARRYPYAVADWKRRQAIAVIAMELSATAPQDIIGELRGQSHSTSKAF